MEDEATFRRLGFFDRELSAQSVESVEFEQCRFRGTDFSGTTLANSGFTDCLFESGNLANLRGERSSMRRVSLSILRMTGFHWIDGSLRDVTVSECRMDLAVFRFTEFYNVSFDGCNLTRADFQDANVSGVQFTNCDLTGAQFSHAKMAGTVFTNCVLEGIGGVTSLSGTTVVGGDLAALFHALAAEMGIKIGEG